MNCDWSDKLDRYVDGELSAGELTEFQEHLSPVLRCAAGALSRLQLKHLAQSARAAVSIPLRSCAEKLNRVSLRGPGPAC